MAESAELSNVYEVGEEVNLVRGIYRSYKHAVYQGDYGDKMCTVKIGTGRNAFSRNIRKTSISKQRHATTQTTREAPESVTIDKDTYEKLIKEVADLKLGVNRLQNTLNKFKK